MFFVVVLLRKDNMKKKSKICKKEGSEDKVEVN